MNTPEIFCNEHCETGENPYWDAKHKLILWTDISRGKLFCAYQPSRSYLTVYQGEPVGGFTMQADGSLLLFRVNDIAVRQEVGTLKSVIPFHDAGAVRFNDVIADPEGRVFAGTIGTTDESGGLYRIDLDGTITKLFGGTGCSNGMGFSPDLRTFYWTCSTTRRIFRFDYEAQTGALTNRTLFYAATPDEGIPDGLTVDAKGNIWSARWDGGALVKHAPDGSVIERIQFPVAKISSVCFGGKRLNQCFVTTAGGKPDSDSLDGALFQMLVPVKGRVEFQSRILI